MVICQRRGLAFYLFGGFGSQGNPRVGWTRGLLGSRFQRLGGWSGPAGRVDRHGLESCLPLLGFCDLFSTLFVVKEMRLVWPNSPEFGRQPSRGRSHPETLNFHLPAQTGILWEKEV